MAPQTVPQPVALRRGVVGGVAGRRVRGPVRVVGHADVEGVVADEREVDGGGEGGEGFLEGGGDGLDFDAEGVVLVEDFGGFVVDLVAGEEDGAREGELEGGG